MTAIATHPPKPALGRFKLGQMKLGPTLLLVLMALLVGLPLVFLVLGSFSTAKLPSDLSWANLGLANYAKVWGSRSTYDVISNTFIYVVGATAFGIVMATALAWLTERTNMPGKIWVYGGVTMTLAIPGMLQAMAWVLLFSPRIGFVNVFFKNLLGLEAMPFNIYTLTGLVVVEGLRLVPTAFLMLVPLLRSMDPALEEAAAMSGANQRSTLRKVTMRLMLPGLVAVVIYQAITALEVFEVPGILGLPGGIYVFSTKIYSILYTPMGTPEYGQANALAIIYVFIAVAAIWLYSRVIRRSERFTIVSGKGYRPRLNDLGHWRWAGVLFVFLFMLFAIILPFLTLLYVSFLPFLQAPSIKAFNAMSLRNYTTIWNMELIGTVMRNTALLVVVTSTATVVFSFLVSIIVVRSKFWGRKLLDQLAFLPHAIPGMVIGLAFFWMFLQFEKVNIPIHGGILAISIVFTVGFMAYGTRSMNAAILQIHKDLEEAAQTSGAPTWRVMWRIFLPLLMPTVIGVWIWTMLHAVRNAGVPLILYEGSDHQVLSVLIWNLWDQGQMGMVAAIGTLMIVGLLLLTFCLRFVRFGARA
ncbi:MAG TPA: iron ABC transporter permease [Alphaproteobacteria bacterium]